MSREIANPRRIWKAIGEKLKKTRARVMRIAPKNKIPTRWSRKG
jgi:hypothetical protein